MKKKKLNFAFIAGLGYCDYYRTKINGVSGWAYIMYNNLSETQKKYINSFNNTRIGSRTFIQAPEQKKDIIFLTNKCF